MGVKDKIKEYWPYLLVLIIVTVVHLFYFFNAEVPAHDLAAVHFPRAEALRISIQEHGDWWPLWYPFGFSGSPFLMKPVPGPDSFLGILLFLMPTVFAVKWTFVLYFLLAGISMFSFMVYLKVDKRFALIAALVYMLNGHMSKIMTWGWMTTVGGYAILPLAFLFGMKTLKEKGWIKNGMITGVILAIFLRFSTDMKVPYWFALLFGLYMVYNLITSPSKQLLKKTVIVAALMFLVFFGLSAHRILPNIDFIKDSSRGDTPWELSSTRQLQYTSMWNRLVEPVYEGMPQVRRVGTGDHLGIIAFIFALAAIFYRIRDKRVLFFTLGALFSLMITSNTFSLYRIFWNILPLFKSLRYMDRSLFLFSFCMSILAGFGAKALYDKIKLPKRPVYIGMVILIVVNLAVFGFSPYTYGREEWSDADKAIEDNHILKELSEKGGLFRIQTLETRGIDWGTDFWNVPFRLEHIYQYDTMWYPPYMNTYLGVSFSDPAKFWGMLNVKYVTSQQQVNMTGFTFKKKFPDCADCFPDTEPWSKAWGPYLFENERFLPRAYIVDDAVLVIGSDDAVLQTIYGMMLSPSFDPKKAVMIKGRQTIDHYSGEELARYAAVVLTPGTIGSDSPPILEAYKAQGGVLMPDILAGQNTMGQEEVNTFFESLNGSFEPIDDADVIMHSFDKREILLKDQKGFMVYSEKFSLFDGWRVKDSSKNDLELLNADGVITGVYVDGQDSVTFSYSPGSYRIGLTITLLTIVLLVLLLIWKWKK
ncbi:YfhO family protein [Candidatus Woesearchaeota archaeon]|nr:YfhO family protein [Candidatus Woesearchaeota archaeon]